MKKNNMMRTATGLSVLTLLTSSVLFGTFAKYTTANNGKDSAKVAKFGVVINVDDDMGLFKTTYTKDDQSATSANTVVSASTDRKIAPGTKGSMSFSITGTPEVATKLSVAIENAKIAHLPAGEYTLASGKFAEKECTVTTTADYEPIKWYFGEKPVDDATVYDKTLVQLKTELEEQAKEYTSNTDLAKNYYIGWKWDFDPVTAATGTWEGASAPYPNAKISDFLDTYLGDEDTLQTESFDLKIAITQID